MSKPYTFLKPYTAKSNCVYLEGGLLMTTANAQIASQLSTALNGAYNMGRYHEQIYKET